MMETTHEFYKHEYEPYILNELNMERYLKYKVTSDKVTKGHRTETETIQGKDFSNKSLFIPREQDTLFWCYYIISNGECSYELLHVKNALIAKQLKIQYVTKIRENKAILKPYKLDSLANIENNLANDHTIHIKTVIALCAIDRINVIFVRRNTYFEWRMTDDAPVYIIREITTKSKYIKKYGFETATELSLQNIQSTLLQVETLSNPIKSLSSYKLADLLFICNKLAIQTVHIETGKTKTKHELYESIIQYF